MNADGDRWRDGGGLRSYERRFEVTPNALEPPRRKGCEEFRTEKAERRIAGRLRLCSRSPSAFIGVHLRLKLFGIRVLSAPSAFRSEAVFHQPRCFNVAAVEMGQ